MASATNNMKEKVIEGWILGKNGMYQVNPKWKIGEETLLKNSPKGVVNIKKEAMGPLMKEGEGLGMVDNEKPAAPAVGNSSSNTNISANTLLSLLHNTR